MAMAAQVVGGAAPAASRLPFNVNQILILKSAGCAVLGLAGAYWLFVGKRDQSVNAMLLGGVLVMLAFLVFC